MERLRSLTLAALVAALAPGCIHVHTDAAGKVKSVEMTTGAEPAADAGVKQASATVPAAAVPAVAGGLAKLAPKLPTFGSNPPAVSLFATWQNRIVKLPDPTADGKFKPGLVGQLFMFGAGPKMPFAPAEGKVTVELYDASRPDAGEPVRLGSWTFEKDVLNRLVTTDERFGKCYALFLPWPTYTPAVSRVKLMAKYEPEHGFALHADPVTMTIDTTSGPEGPVVQRTSTTGPLPPSGAGPLAPPVTAMPVQPSAPVGPPPGLPPLTITVPSR